MSEVISGIQFRLRRCTRGRGSSRPDVQGRRCPGSALAQGREGQGIRRQAPYVGFALYFQFKRSKWISQRHPNSPTWDHVRAPHYRWPIDTDGHQHAALLNLQREIKARLHVGDVLYAAPKFHLPAQLDDAYLRSEVLDRSTLLTPSEFGDRCGVHRSVFAPRTGFERILSEPREPERLWSSSDVTISAERHAESGERVRLDLVENALHSALVGELQRDVERDPGMPIAQRISGCVSDWAAI